MDAEAFARALGVSRETLSDFETWRGLLARWNARINLMAPGEVDRFWRRHALDGAQIVDAMPDDALTWLDLGSGGGVPGLAIAFRLKTRPGAEVHLVESNQKKVAFLRAVIRETGAPAVVHAQRIEDAIVPSPDVITARALAPLDKLLSYAHRFAVSHTQMAFLKGRSASDELTQARAHWHMSVETHPSRSNPDGVCLAIRGLRHHDRERSRAAHSIDR
ncbi:MAG: 16S rRNA (guanine(527)-N(7))-methyltransferase RsmG [Maricaulaceae bacterium]